MATVWAFIRTIGKKKAKIRFRVTGNNGGIAFHTSEFSIYPDHWDAKKQGVKARSTFDGDKITFDKAILERKALLMAIAEKENIILTSKQLKEEVSRVLRHGQSRRILQPSSENTLLEYIEHFMDHAQNRKDKSTGRLISHSHIKQYRVAYKHLKTFAGWCGKSDFTFSQINNRFYDLFVDFLEKEIPGIKPCYTANTVGKNIKILKTFLNEAKREGLNPTTAYLEFRVIAEDIDNVFLTEEELSIIKNVDLQDHPILDKTRDYFLLLAWTGCRFSDLKRITESDIKSGFISFRQQKTNTRVTIPLHPVVVEILNKYNCSFHKGFCNQRFNEYIKIVAENAGINTLETITRTIGGVLRSETLPKSQLISSHTGRRSFATNMYLKGIPTLTIMSITGHKTEKAFLKYIKISQAQHAEIMAHKWAELYK